MTRAPYIAATLALGAWLALGGSAAAAPQYVGSEPAAGAEMHEAPNEVSITFSEPLDASSEIKVFDECDRRLDDGNTLVDLNPTTMRVGIDLKPSGPYKVAYDATGVAGVTGTTSGTFKFVVHGGPGCDGGGAHDHHDDDDHDGKHDHNGGHDDHGGKHDDHGGSQDDHADHGADAGHSTHSAPTDDGDHGEHAAGPGGNGGGSPDNNKDEEPQTFTRGESPFPKLEPDDWAVFVGLGLAIALGAGGGVFLRATES